MRDVLWCGKSSHFTKEALESFVDTCTLSVNGSFLFSSLTGWVKGRCGSLSLPYTHPTSQSSTPVLSYLAGRFSRSYWGKSLIKIVCCLCSIYMFLIALYKQTRPSTNKIHYERKMKNIIYSKKKKLPKTMVFIIFVYMYVFLFLFFVFFLQIVLHKFSVSTMLRGNGNKLHY